MNRIINLINSFYNFVSLSENIIDEDNIDKKISKYEYIDRKKIKTEIILLFGKNFESNFNNDKDYNTIIKYLNKEKKYIIRLMEFEKEISIQNIVLKSRINYLIEQFKIYKKIDKLENDKWIMINYATDDPIYYVYIINPIKKYANKILIYFHLIETRQCTA